MFHNTGISTYVWVLSNKKRADEKGKVQLINAVHLYQKMRKSLGSKRQELGESDIALITKTFGAFEPVETTNSTRTPPPKARAAALPQEGRNKTFAAKA